MAKRIRVTSGDGTNIDLRFPGVAALVSRYLDGLAAGDLRTLVFELMDQVPASARLVAARAASATQSKGGPRSTSTQEAQAAAAIDLEMRVVDAVAELRPGPDDDDDYYYDRPHYDYQGGSDSTSSIDEVLDELEHHIDTGTAAATGPALRRAITELRDAIDNDEYGLPDDVWGSCQRALDLYARACSASHPDPVELARWLVDVRVHAPEGITVSLDAYLPALGESGLAAYRLAVLALEGDVDTERSWAGQCVTAMLVELADLDGDVDRAVELLRRGRPDPVGITRRLAAASRAEEAIPWAERTFDAGRVRVAVASEQRLAMWLEADEVAGLYVAADRRSEAFSFMRRVFTRGPGWTAFGVVGAFADRFGLGDVERAWARDEARRLARAGTVDGTPLVDIALGEGDADAAWAAADAYGAAGLAERLATETADTHPLRAVAHHRGVVDAALVTPNSPAYSGIAARLALMGRLSATGGQSEAFDAYVRGLRERYRNRPALRRALDRAGLPR